MGHSDFMSLETFVRIFHYRVYECFYGALSMENSKLVRRFLASVDVSRWSKEKMLTMLKKKRRPRTKTLEEFRSQVEEVYGKANQVSVRLLRD